MAGSTRPAVPTRAPTAKPTRPEPMATRAIRRVCSSTTALNGGFAVARMTNTGLLAQMGLRVNDVILAIDGEPMTDIDTIAATTVDLFLGSRVTSGFTLTIGRGREVIAKAVRVR